MRAQVTSMPILVLVTRSTWREYGAALRPLERIAPHVFLTVVDDTFYLKPLMRYNVKQERPKLKHAYGTIQVLNPEYTGMLNKVLFIDIDTFVIQNLDEVFCAPHRAAAERPLPPGVTKRPPSRNFNGGVFQFSPAEQLYPQFLKEMVAYMKEPGEKKFAMQYLLHKVFGNSYFCLSQHYNCMGVQATGPVSPKCGISTEAELLQNTKVLHCKLMKASLQGQLPQVAAMWLESRNEAVRAMWRTPAAVVLAE